jgi:4,5:9,10-diseco-3-hydroxy-5,9,17-trioxoandrosta-1(10),2-diene-4-oate hydrolase
LTEQSTHVDGLRIRYLEAGQGQPVVLLHGASLGSSADVFERNFAPLVEAGLRPIAMDRPGYGLSDGPGDRTPAGHRRFLLGFMDALGLDSALVVGHSQQGGVTAQVALDHPDRIPRAVILGGGGVLPPSPEGDEPDAEGQQLTSEPTLEQVRDILKANLYNHDLITPDALALRHRMSLGSAFQFYSQRSAGRPAGGASPGGATATEPVWKRVGMNPEQFLLIFGRQDKPTTEQRCELARQQFPKLRLVLLDHCAHLAQWDQADELVRQTIAFARAGAVAV